MKKLLFIIMMLCGLVACGGDDSSANAGNSTDLTQQCNDPSNCTVEEIEFILELPEEPTPEMPGYDTIPGIDSNGKNGRDDIERKIGLIYFPDIEKIKLLNYSYEQYAKSIDAGADNDVEKYRYHMEQSSLASECFFRKYEETIDESIWMSVAGREDRHYNGLMLDREMQRDYIYFLSVAEQKEKCPKLIESLKSK